MTPVLLDLLASLLQSLELSSIGNKNCDVGGLRLL